MPKLDGETPYLVQARNLVLLPDTDNYREWVPDDATFVVVQGLPYWAAKNTPALNELMYSLGEPVPSPIFFTDYDWSNVEIFAEQAQMAGLISTRRRCYNLSDMGCGKTIGSLLAIDWLIQKNHIKRALVAAPLSILRLVWEAEIHKHFPRLKPVVLHGTADQRIKKIVKPDWNVAIINHEGIGVMEDKLIDTHFGCIIVDEASTYRDTRTSKFKSMKRVMHGIEFAAALTGSPTPNAPSDAYGLALLFTPDRINMSFRAFRQTVETEVRPHKWLPRPGAAAKVFKLLQPAVRFKRSDIIQLKEMSSQTRRVELSAKQKLALTTLRREAVAQFPDGVVEGINPAVLRNKLLQISAGAVYTSGENRQVVDLEATPRQDMLRTILDEAEGKVIVLVGYKHVQELLVSNLDKAGGYNAMLVNGDVNPKERVEIFRSFQDRLDPLRVLVAHPGVMAHGLNLTAANIIVWYAPIDSRDEYEQANARIMRMGQDKEQLILHLSGSPEEDAAYRNLEAKGDMQDIIKAIFDAAQNPTLEAA
jgi:SNF2 family DNA or RNA helicase